MEGTVIYSAARALEAPGCPPAEPCPPVEPCRCDCQGNPDRKLIDAGPKKPFALPFSVGKDYKHVSADAEGDDQHKGGGGKQKFEHVSQNDIKNAALAEAATEEKKEAEAKEPAPFEPPPKPMADTAKPPAFLAAMFHKEHGGGAGADAAAQPQTDAGGAAALAAAPAAAPAPAPASAAAAATGIAAPPASALTDQCGLPDAYRGAMEALSWVGRPKVDATFVIAEGLHAAEHKRGVAKVHSTLYPGSRTALGGQDLWHLVNKNDWDPNCMRAIRETLTARPGADFIDVGAWVGVTTMMASIMGAGKVLALEPDPAAFEELWANVRLNPELVGSKAHVYRHCASDRVEKATITSVVGSTSWMLDGWDAASAAPGEVEAPWTVHCSPISAIAAAHGMTPSSVGLLRISPPPGMELYIGKTVLDWVRETPPGAPKPGVWLVLHTQKWGDKAMGESALLRRACMRALSSFLHHLLGHTLTNTLTRTHARTHARQNFPRNAQGTT